MGNEMEVAGKPGPLAGLGEMGEAVVSGRDTRVPLSGKGSKKGNYFVGKYLGTQAFKYEVSEDADDNGDIEVVEDAGGKKKLMKKMTVARFACLETNMEGDTGAIIPGEVVSVPFTGLLAWGLGKVAQGRFVYVRFDGKGPGEDKKGNMREMNRFTVRDVTDVLAKQGIS